MSRKVALYSRPGCHLCDDVKAVLSRVAAQIPFELTVYNIDEDPALKVRYGWDIPVVLVDGEQVAKHRLDEALLRKKLVA